MKKTINISIQKPCSQKFNEFDKTELGGFCNSCTKEVIDFTTKSDKEIFAYFKTKKGNTCGHFHKNQLKTYYEPRNINELKKYRFFSAISFSLVSLFFSNDLSAQKCITNTMTTEPIKNNKKKPIIATGILKGLVCNSIDKQPLPGVSIVLKNSFVGTETDFDGNFELKQIKEGDRISFYYLGYKTQEIIVRKNQTFLNVIMEEDTSVLDGLITVGEVDTKATYKTKRSFWQRVKSIF